MIGPDAEPQARTSGAGCACMPMDVATSLDSTHGEPGGLHVMVLVFIGDACRFAKFVLISLLSALARAAFSPDTP